MNSVERFPCSTNRISERFLAVTQDDIGIVANKTDNSYYSYCCLCCINVTKHHFFLRPFPDRSEELCIPSALGTTALAICYPKQAVDIK